MIMDENLEFCDAVSVAGSAGTALVGDVVDLTDIGKDVGQTGLPLYLVITCATSIITGGAAGTIQFILASDAQAAIAADGTESRHWVSGTFVTDDDTPNELDAGATIAIVPLPMGGFRTYERYLGIETVIATTTITAGAINAFLTFNPAAWKAYADASN